VATRGKSKPVSYRSAKRSTLERAPSPHFLVEKIISGGQTGVDRAALDFAIKHRIPHSGWCPQGRIAEDGTIDGGYELKETPGAAYAQRTEWNVRDSDGTVIFSISPKLNGGSALTHELAAECGKPCLHLSKQRDDDTAVAKLRQFIRQNKIKTLNVAGPRLSTEPAAPAFASEVLEAL
jgi:hypothetical protein